MKILKKCLTISLIIWLNSCIINAKYCEFIHYKNISDNNCNVTVKYGEFIHDKNSSDMRITIENDSVIRYKSNYSMLSFDIKGKYLIENETILYIPSYDTIGKCYDTLPFSTQIIKIKNKNTLEINGIKFKHKQ